MTKNYKTQSDIIDCHIMKVETAHIGGCAPNASLSFRDVPEAD